MGRHIAYDPAELRQNLMRLFWAKGFAETSLADLEQATGLNRRQLYNGIGDKRAMFLAALEDFTNASGQSLLAPLEAPSAGRAEIKALFTAFVSMAEAPEGWNGCLVCSTSQEDIAADADVAAQQTAFFQRIRAAHLNALTRATLRGELSLDKQELKRRADALFGSHVALCILGRAGVPSDQLRRIAAQALDDIG